MAITKFQREVWSTQFNKSLEKITSLRKHSDFKYEKDSKNAKEIRILGVERPTIRDYVKGTKLTLENATDNSISLVIDTFKYFNFLIYDVDKVQSTPGAMELLTDEATRGLSEEGDKKVASIIKAGVEASENSLAQSAVVTLTKSNVIDTVEAGFSTLYTNDCKIQDTYHLEVSPKFYTTLRPTLTELYTDNIEMAKKGYVGKYGNALVSIENLLPTGKAQSSDASDNVCYNILRTNKAVAFVEQINEIEAYRPSDDFGDALKGLYGCGATIVRPKEIYVIKTAM